MSKQEFQLHNRGNKRHMREQKEAMIAKGWKVASEDHTQVTLERERRTKPPKRTTRPKSSGDSGGSKQKVEKHSKAKAKE